MTNKNLIFFNINKKIIEPDYQDRLDQILKTSVSDQDKTFVGQQIIQQYTEQSKKRLQTSMFLEQRSQSNALKKILYQSPRSTTHQFAKFFSPKSRRYNQPFDKLLKTENNISRRMQILEVEKSFQSEITNDNRNEYLTRMESFIKELLFEEQRELSHLFNTFMREMKHDLTEQQILMQKNQKQYEAKTLENTNKQVRQCFEKQTALEKLIEQLKTEQSNMQQEKEKAEKDRKELIFRNEILITKVEQRNKIINHNEKIIKQQQNEISILKQKIACYENKLQQSMARIFQLHRQQTLASNSPTSIANNKQDEIQDDSLSIDSDIKDQAEAKEEEQLNQLEINYERIIVQCQKEIQIENDLLQYYTKNIEVQTNLVMVNPQFDIITQSNINNALLYTEFIEQVGRKKSEDCLIEEVIDSAYEQIDAQSFNFNMNGSKLLSPQNPKKETKVKQIVSFVNFLKSRQQQLEKDLTLANDQIANYTQLNISLNLENQDLLTENEKLQIQLAELQNRVPQVPSKDQIEVRSEKEIVQSSSEQVQVSQKKMSVLLKQGTFLKESKKQRKGPQLGQKVVVSYDFQKDQSKKLIEKIRLKPNQKFSNFMPLKLVLKYITTLYTDKIQSQKEQKSIRDQDMATYIYNYYLSQYGYTKITEQKFLVLVLSVKKNLKIIRVNIFAKFMGMLEMNVNYSVEEQQKYLEAVEYMNNYQNLGTSIKDNESEMKHYVPYVRALSYIGSLIFSQQNEEQYQLKHDIEQLKELDPNNINKSGIIDFDLMMIKVLSVFRNNIEKTKLYVINAFAASDLDGNGMCNLDEFLILNKYIEPDKYDEGKWIEVFDDNADVIAEEEKNLSFDRFCIICMEYSLFSDQAQNRFLQIKNNSDCITKFEQLKELWNTNYNFYMEQLLNANIDEQEKEQWVKILTVLNEKIIESPEQKKPLLIAYKIFLNESRVLKS